MWARLHKLWFDIAGLEASLLPVGAPLFVFILWFAFFTPALGGSDPLGTPGPYGLPLPALSFDTMPRTISMRGQVYKIPRNYIFTVSEWQGQVGNVSMRALLPDLVGLTTDNKTCFIDLASACYSGIVVIGLESGGVPVPSGSQSLANIRGIIYPERHKGPCGLEYFEDTGTIAQQGVAFEWFVYRLPGDAEISILRCPKSGSAVAPRCNASRNLDDGNQFYYTFDRARLCTWAEIKEKVTTLLSSFREEPKQ
jgi:hypothetical protein